MSSTELSPSTDVAGERRPRVGGRPRYIGPLILVASLLAMLGGIAQQLRGQASYVALAGPPWFLILGTLLAPLAWVSRRSSGLSRTAALAATVLVLPSAVLLVFHALRLVGAIPYPVDPLALATSVAAVALVAFLWCGVAPLRAADGSPLATPRWVAHLGLCAALLYPALKTCWALGGRWLAPADLRPGFDADYLVPVAFALCGSLATRVALRWWDRPAPRFAHPAAVAGGLALSGLGLGGTYATATARDGGDPLIGVLVYDGWLVWGLSTLAVAARLSSRRAPTSADLAAGIDR